MNALRANLPALSSSIGPLPAPRLRNLAVGVGAAALFPLTTTLATLQLTAPLLGGSATGAISAFAIGVGLGSAGFVVSLKRHFARVRKSASYREISRPEAPELYAILDDLARRAGAPTPKLAVLDQDGRNSFSFGLGRRDAVVAVTRGLLESLSRAEFEAVIAHEIAHIRSGDASVMASVGALLGAASGIDAMTRAVLTPIQRRLPAKIRHIGVGAALERLMMAAFLRMAPPARDFEADRFAASLIGAREPVHGAFMKIAEAPQLQAGDPLIPAMAFCGPTAFQPSLESRLRTLFSTAESEPRKAASPAPQVAKPTGRAPALTKASAALASLRRMSGATPSSRRASAAIASAAMIVVAVSAAAFGLKGRAQHAAAPQTAQTQAPAAAPAPAIPSATFNAAGGVGQPTAPGYAGAPTSSPPMIGSAPSAVSGAPQATGSLGAPRARAAAPSATSTGAVARPAVTPHKPETARTPSTTPQAKSTPRPTASAGASAAPRPPEKPAPKPTPRRLEAAPKT